MTRHATIEELADRMEIGDLFSLYGRALDDGAFELLDDVFTRDAHLSYPDAEMDGDYATISQWMPSKHSNQRSWFHMIGNSQVSLDGDHAKAVSTFFFVGVNHDDTKFYMGGEYHDVLIRTPDGWRIAQRIERPLWTVGNLHDLSAKELR